MERRSRFGKMFYSCANYPDCKFAIWYKPVPRPCPQCGAPFLVEKYSKKTGPYIACLKKECGYKEEPKAETGLCRAQPSRSSKTPTGSDHHSAFIDCPVALSNLSLLAKSHLIR